MRFLNTSNRDLEFEIGGIQFHCWAKHHLEIPDDLAAIAMRRGMPLVESYASDPPLEESIRKLTDEEVAYYNYSNWKAVGEGWDFQLIPLLKDPYS